MKSCGIHIGILGLLLLCSYNHKELVFEIGNEITVNFDWSSAPLASPNAMRLTVFNGDAQPVSFAAAGHQSVEVELMNGVYQFVAYNSDTEVLHTRGYNYETFEIFTQEAETSAFARLFNTRVALPRAKGTESESFIEEPDPLWTSALGRISVPNIPQITMPMKSAIIRYTFTVSNVENLDNVRSMAATISGMSDSYYPSLGICSDTYCTIPFAMERDGETTITGTVRTFGYRTDDSGAGNNIHKLAIYVETKEGEKVYYTFDVTNILDSASEEISETGDAVIDVEINNLPIPEPIYNGSGLHPIVDKWQEVEIEIDL